MVISLIISRHTAADCPRYNEKTRKPTLEFASKMNELTTKYGVKILGAWVVHSEHLNVQVLEAPSYEVLEAFSQEPVVMKAMDYQTSEVKVAITMQESFQRMMQA